MFFSTNTLSLHAEAFSDLIWPRAGLKFADSVHRLRKHMNQSTSNRLTPSRKFECVWNALELATFDWEQWFDIVWRTLVSERRLESLTQLHLSFEIFPIYKVIRQSWKVLSDTFTDLWPFQQEEEDKSKGALSGAHLISALSKRNGWSDRNLFLHLFLFYLKTLWRGEEQSIDTHRSVCVNNKIALAFLGIIIDESWEKKVCRNLSSGSMLCFSCHAMKSILWAPNRKCVFPAAAVAAVSAAAAAIVENLSVETNGESVSRESIQMSLH